MHHTGRDAQRTRFRRPLGVAIMLYKATLGLSEIAVGVLLAVPSFDPQATFARLSAEELREDPGDRFVALVTRHLPSLLHHRGLVALGLIMLGWPSWSPPPPCGRARNGAATCWPGPWPCCCRSTFARPSCPQPLAMFCSPQRTPPSWSCWPCSCVGDCQAGRLKPSGLDPRCHHVGRRPPWSARSRTERRRAALERGRTRWGHRHPAPQSPASRPPVPEAPRPEMQP